MEFLYFALFAGGIVAADQVTKFLTVANIGLWEDIPFPGAGVAFHSGQRS